MDIYIYKHLLIVLNVNANIIKINAMFKTHLTLYWMELLDKLVIMTILSFEY